jgi:signal transduction histidine kinase
MSFAREYDDHCPRIACDPDLMKMATVNLLSNAVKYGRPDTTIRVTVEPGDQRLGVAVWNRGPGFTDEQRSRLFRKFSRLDSPELKQVKGTGVGLYSTWRIINLHHGRIRARSAAGEWAEFAFTVPTQQPADAPDPEQQSEANDA